MYLTFSKVCKWSQNLTKCTSRHVYPDWSPCPSPSLIRVLAVFLKKLWRSRTVYRLRFLFVLFVQFLLVSCLEMSYCVILILSGALRGLWLLPFLSIPISIFLDRFLYRKCKAKLGLDGADTPTNQNLALLHCSHCAAQMLSGSTIYRSRQTKKGAVKHAQNAHSEHAQSIIRAFALHSYIL